MYIQKLLLQILFASLTISLYSQPLPKTIPPKNIILMIGDGMGFNCVYASDYYFGPAAFTHFPVKQALATYPFGSSYDPSIAWTDTAYILTGHTESAAAATAMATGFKTKMNYLGLSPDGDTLINLTEYAKNKGKSAGVISSVPFTHATPAGFSAHNSSRSNYPQLAYDILLKGDCDVVMGCGNPEFNNDGQSLGSNLGYCGYVGDSTLWNDLKKGDIGQIQGDVDNDGAPDQWALLTAKNDFSKLMSGPTPKRVLGCPEVHSTLQQERSAPALLSNVPTLAEMVKGGLNVLDNNPAGFFLMAEGGAIDWANHENNGVRMLEEMKSFRDAVDTVISYIERYSSWEETLLIITADHECGNLWGGKPFTPVKDNGIGVMPGIQYNSHDHTNSLVPFYAKGSSSDEFIRMAEETDPMRGQYIQNTEIAEFIFSLWK